MNKKGLNYSKYGYIFSIPFVVAYLIFSLYPVLYTVVIAFTDLKGAGATTFHFQQDLLKNFKDVLSNSSFQTAFKNTCKIWLCNFVPQMGMALLLTAWFTDSRCNIKGQGFFKVVFYMPNIITAATVAILFGSLFGYPVGPINDVLTSLHIIPAAQDWLVKKSTAQGVVIFIQTWQWFGYTMITLISGVIGIDPSIFEAAEIDGANRVQTFLFVTIPNIRTIMIFTLVTSLIGGLNMFDIPKLFIVRSGPDEATLTTSVFIQQMAFMNSYQYGIAAAASLIMFVIIVICSAVVFYIMRDKDEAAAKKLRKESIKQWKAAQKAAQGV